MTDVTAGYSAELRLRRLPQMVIIADAHMPIATSSQALDRQSLSDNRQESGILAPLRSIPEWLDAVKRRIRDSIMPNGQEIENNGQWLTEEIASVAGTFFEEVSDLLPSEPFIYASTQGDLVAEFTPKFGSLTAIVSPKSVLLYAVVNGRPEHREVNFLGEGSTALRRDLDELTELLRTGRNGAVGSSR
jgi:hypothetical protein